MAIRAYHDFVLFTHDVEEDDHGYIRSFMVRVFDSPVGQGEEAEPVQVDDCERLQELSRELEEREFDGKMDRQRELGALLSELLLPPQAREMFLRSYGWLMPDEGLRLRLRLDRDLAWLPWEFVYLGDTDERSPLCGFIALNPRISVVRHEALALPAEWLLPPAPAEKRRVVIAMATPRPYGTYPALELLPDEQKEIREALGRVRGVDVAYLPEYRQPDDCRAVPGATLAGLEEP
jgi:hypothetical protein